MYKRTRLILIIVAAALILAIALIMIFQDDPASAPPSTTMAPIVENENVVSAIMTMPPVGHSETTGAGKVISDYFDAWMAKDTAAMEALLVPSERGKADYSEMEYEASINVSVIQERPSEEAMTRYSADWYDGTPTDIALVLTSYTVVYNEAGKTLYLRDGLERTDYQFWLIKTNAGSDWQIVMQGY